MAQIIVTISIFHEIHSDMLLTGHIRSHGSIIVLIFYPNKKIFSTSITTFLASDKTHQ